MQYFRLSFVVLVIALIGGGCASQRLPSESNILRVLTFNIRHGEGTDGKVDIERVAKLIKDSRADIVALQEVDRWTERSGKIDIMSELVDRTDMAYAFGKTLDFDGGAYGNGILTRFPIYEERNFLYPQTSEGEQRGLLQLVLDVRGLEIVLMNTHLDHRESDIERVASVDHILEAAKSSTPRPVILCGDMNDVPTSRTIGLIKRDFIDSWEISGSGEGFSYPTQKPDKRIDYIFVSKPVSETSVSLRPISVRVLNSDASDHLPILVEFEIINN